MNDRLKNKFNEIWFSPYLNDKKVRNTFIKLFFTQIIYSKTLNGYTIKDEYTPEIFYTQFVLWCYNYAKQQKEKRNIRIRNP